MAGLRSSAQSESRLSKFESIRALPERSGIFPELGLQRTLVMGESLEANPEAVADPPRDGFRHGRGGGAETVEADFLGGCARLEQRCQAPLAER